MNRILVSSLLAIVLLAVTVAFAGTRRVRSDTRPNVVLIIIDTLRADKLGAYGYPLESSPELDSMARHGVRFTRVMSMAPWTRPSIGSLLTSRYPRELGIYKEQYDVLANRFETLAEVLKAHGYRTLGATANPNINSVFNFEQGFDHYTDSTVVFRWMHRNPGQKVASHSPLQRANEIFDGLLQQLDSETAQQRARPHFLEADVMEVHESRRYQQMLRPEYQLLFPQVPPLERHYIQAVRQVSADISQFIEKLTRRPGWRNTLFIITSDHGEGLDSHPHLADSAFHGAYVYQCEVHVPLILFTPGTGVLPKRRVVDQRVRLLDVMPTVLGLLGIDDDLPPMDGTSLVPLIRRGRGVSLPKVFVTETEFRDYHKVAAYGDRWAYIENRDHRPGMQLQELQPIGEPNDGPYTNQLALRPADAARLQKALYLWEQAHHRAQPASPGRALTSAEKDQLRALGYAR